ncbi:MAG: hypothetical protein L6R40_007847 [Gallowayella cf. fulva]|nr:MAG: hypothetical protein L6R40_007847 [Xanthomendoza cf. fulva]
MNQQVAAKFPSLLNAIDNLAMGSIDWDKWSGFDGDGNKQIVTSHEDWIAAGAIWSLDTKSYPSEPGKLVVASNPRLVLRPRDGGSTGKPYVYTMQPTATTARAPIQQWLLQKQPDKVSAPSQGIMTSS